MRNFKGTVAQSVCTPKPLFNAGYLELGGAEGLGGDADVYFFWTISPRSGFKHEATGASPWKRAGSFPRVNTRGFMLQPVSTGSKTIKPARIGRMDVVMFVKTEGVRNFV